VIEKLQASGSITVLAPHLYIQARSQEFVMWGLMRGSRGQPGARKSGAELFLQFFNKNRAFFGIFRLRFLILKHTLTIAEKG